MSVVDALVAAGAVILATGVAGRLLALAILRSSRNNEAFAGVVGKTKIVAPGFGMVAGVTASLLFGLVQVGLDVSGNLAVAAVVAGLYVFVVALGVTVAWSRGLEPLVTTLLPDEMAPPDWQRRRWRLVGIAILGTLSVLVEVGLVLDLVPFEFVGLLAVVLYLGLYWPLTMPDRVAPGGSPSQCRPPTEAERTRIQQCFERFGRSHGRVLVSPNAAGTAVIVAGQGDGKTVGLTQAFLERADDEALAVALAQADERARRGYLRYTLWILTLAVVDVLLVAYWLQGAFALPYLGAALGVSLVVFIAGPIRWNAQATVAADRFAADRFGAETVWQTYEQFGDDISWTSVRLEVPPALEALGIRSEPEMGERIERLKDEFGGETPPLRTDGGANGDEGDRTAWPATRRRVLAASGLLVVGLVLALALPYFVGDLQEYAGNPTVERFDPAQQPGVADADTDVVDLDDRVANGSADFRESIETAATTGEYEATGEAVPGELRWLADDERFPTPEYVVYDGRYYEWYGYAGTIGSSVSVQLEELTVDEAMDEIATPYAETTSGTRELIDGEGDRWGVASVVVRNGTYYAVSSPFWDRVAQSPTGFTKQIVGAAASALLLPVGVAFAVVGTWLLGRLWRRRSTVISRASAATLAVVAGLIGGGLALGSSSQFVGHHATMAAGLVGLVVAGDYIRRGRWLPVAAIVLGVPVVVVVASIATGWVFGLILGPPGLMAAGITGWPLLGYGYYLGRAPGSETTSPPDTVEGEGPDVD